MPDCGTAEEVQETILDCLGDLDVPIGFGAPVGHGESHLAVPFGIPVRLQIAREGANGPEPAGSLSGLESLVA
jgi:muramoyltetrapeptide carboxypeptidase LdcA involved in peptidoglycan recycling